MAQSNIGIRFSVDASHARGQVDQLSKTVAGLRDEIEKATQVGDWKQVAQLTQAMDSATSARGQIMQQVKQTQSPLAQQNMQTIQNMQNSFFSGAGWILLQNSLNQITQGIIKSMDAALTAAKQRASGDYTGAALAEYRAPREIAGQAIGAGIGALGFFGGPLIGALTMGIGSEIGKFIGGIGAKELEADLAYSQQYKAAFQYIDNLNQLFGGMINHKSLSENNQQGLSMYGHAANAATGTGLSTQDFISALKETAVYGNMNETRAMNMLQTQALWSRFTGTDLSAIQKYSGAAYRYGGELNATSSAYGGLMAQNMGKGQFSEFLNSLSRIMEEGISKGFVKSSEQIAGNMAMLYKLSGGSTLWQGQQGANRLSQMNNALSNATNLQSVEDVISFGVARELLGNASEVERRRNFINAGKDANLYTGTYVDEMLLLEHGVSANLLRGQFEAVKRLEGNNTAGIIERFKSMYGLNYHGATQVWAMSRNAFDEHGNWKAEFDPERQAEIIREYQTNPIYQSDSSMLQTELNKMNANLVNIGKFKFDDAELNMLHAQAQDVKSILQKLDYDRNRAPETQARVEELARTGAEQIVEERGMMTGGSAAHFHLGIQEFSAAETKQNDPRAQAAAGRFNREILPFLPERPSTEIMDLLEELSDFYYGAVTGLRGLFSEAGNKVGENEFATLNRTMDAILRRLESLDRSIDRLSDNDRDIHINAYLD